MDEDCWCVRREMYNCLTEELPVNIRKGGMTLELKITGVRPMYKERKEKKRFVFPAQV